MLKKRIGFVFVAFFVCYAFLLGGCRKPPAAVKQEGPEEVVREAIQALVGPDPGRYMALLDVPEESRNAAWKIKDYEKRTKRLVRKFARQAKRRGGLTAVDLGEEGIKYTHMVTKEDGTVTYEQTTYERAVEGDTAELTIKMTYGDGSTDDPKTYLLTKKRDGWLLKAE